MKKYKLTPKEKEDLELLRKEIDKYQNILQWQKIRRAEKKLLKLRERYDYRSYKRELLLDKYLVTLRPYAKSAEQTTHGREINDSFFNITLLSAIGWP